MSAALAQVRQPSRQTAETGDAFYCEERTLGYWFYCEKPKAEPETISPALPSESAVTRLDAITAELRELKARAILEPSPANVTAYIRFQREQLDRALRLRTPLLGSFPAPAGKKALIAAVDDLNRDHFVSNPSWTELSKHYSERQCMDLVFTVGQYTQVSMILNSFGVQLDQGQTLDPELKAF